MRTEYVLQATAREPQATATLNAFALAFGQSATVEVIKSGINLRMPFQPDLLAKAKDWAFSQPGLRVRDFLVRTYAPTDFQRAPLVRLDFANCYLVPESTRSGTCQQCSGYLKIPTGKVPARLELGNGIGQHSASIFLSQANAECIAAAGLEGFVVTSWPNDSRYAELRPTAFAAQQLVEGDNAIGLTGNQCAACGRPELRFHLGPVIIDRSAHSGEDFLGLTFMGFQNLACSQRAVAFLEQRFRGVSLLEPVLYRAGA
jgi:hypothetical protein